jgi:FtsP/CotA-like multicopper oxidase with cupredoxin domain
MITRRDFLKIGTTVGTGVAFFWRGDTLYARANASRVAMPVGQLPGGTLAPAAVPKYQAQLLIPPAMPRTGKIKVKGDRNIDYYEIAVRQFQQQILPPGFPPTTVWGYGPKVARSGAAIFNAPSLTIEAKYNKSVRIKWINELRANPSDPASNYLPHLLPVDPTLHWANPPGGTRHRDTRPTFTATPGPYTGPVPIVTHVHGSAHVGDESDGYAEAWFLPVAGNIPADYATVGSWYDFFRHKAASKGYLVPGMSTWEPGTAVFQYPNTQRASTLWYHDHTLGMTRLNVYAGPAGFYIIRGGAGNEVLDSRTGTAAILPHPAPARGDAPGTQYYEIPIAIQDRSFNSDGSLFYPDTRAFFDGITGPYIPDTDISPIWNPEFFGNMMMVNGNTWPFQTVEQRRYRFRFLNGCNSRFLILDFANIPRGEVWQIGNEGGFLAAPVNMTADNGNKILIGPAERADVIVDFTNVRVGSYVLGNVGPDEPFGGGEPGEDFEVADPGTTGQIMEFRVVPAAAPDPTTPPQFLQLPAITSFPEEMVTRPLALLEEMSTYFADAPTEARLGTVAGDPNTATGTATALKWEDPVTENPAVGATEVWEFYNATADAHPMHIHEVHFQVLNRQPIFVDEENKTVHVDPGSVPTPPADWEGGFKDTVVAYPGEVTRVRMQFNTPGQFVWHCHIVEHEDNEMMRPYFIGALDPNVPGLGMAAPSANAGDVAPATDSGELIPEDADADEESTVFIPFVEQ